MFPGGRRHLWPAIIGAWLCIASPLVARAQTPAPADAVASGSVRIIVRDRTDLPVGGATVVLIAGERRHEAMTAQNGQADLPVVPAGEYGLRIEAPGFAENTGALTVRRGRRASREVTLEIAALVEEVDVSPPALEQRMADAFTTELSGSEIEALPEDPDELLAALIELAGGDASVRIDGFLDGTLPPGTRIESIRIRQDGGGAGAGGGGPRIEIRTEPGGDRWRANASARIRDESLNGRNRFITESPDGLTRIGSWAVNGPLVRRKTGLALSLERAQSLEQQTLRAAGLDGTLSSLVRQPDDRLSWSVRVDQSVGSAQTLRLEVRNSRGTAINQGLSEFDLPERAITRESANGEFRVSHNATIAARVVHDARFQVRWRSNEASPASLATAMRVSGALGIGGAQQQGGRRTREFEYEDELMMPLGSRHQLTTGVNVIGGHYEGDEWRNAGGTFTFASLDDLAAGRPATFTQRQGDPHFSYSMYRFGEFVQDEFRVRRNLRLNFALRHEFQTHLSDYTSVAPRVSANWTPSASYRTSFSASVSVAQQPFVGSLYEQTLLVNGLRQRDIVITNPAYPDPFAGGNASLRVPGVIRARDDLRMPMSRRASFNVDQPIGRATRLRLNYTRQQGSRQFRSVNLNAPEYGVRPDAAFSNITEIQSSGRSRNDSLQINFSTAYQPRRLNVSASYTLGEALNDTDSALTLPPDSHDLSSEWGPARQDVRHRFSANFNSDLWAGFRVSGNVRAQSAPAYTITTGLDTNGDGVFNERPAGVGRNSARGARSATMDGTVTWGWNIGQRPPSPAQARRRANGNAAANPYVRLELYAQANNLTNAVNAQGFSGVQTSPFFGIATSAAAPRRFTFGARFSY
jgi:hypothetical protein